MERSPGGQREGRGLRRAAAAAADAGGRPAAGDQPPGHGSAPRNSESERRAFFVWTHSNSHRFASRFRIVSLSILNSLQLKDWDPNQS